LAYNDLTGEIPSSIGNLINITNLWLAQNQLSGQIPPELGNLINAVEILLQGNQLSGEIPEEVCDLIESNNLDISYLIGNPPMPDIINTCD